MSSQGHHSTGSHATQSSALPVISQDYNASQRQSPGEAGASGQQEIPVQPVRSMLDVDDGPVPASGRQHTTPRQPLQSGSAQQAGPGQQHLPELRHESRRISGEHHATDRHESAGQYKIRSMLEDLDLNDPARETGSQHPYTSRYNSGQQGNSLQQQEHDTGRQQQQHSSEEHNTGGHQTVRSLLDVVDEPAPVPQHHEMKRASEQYGSPEQSRREVQGEGLGHQAEGAVKRTRTEEHDQTTTVAPRKLPNSCPVEQQANLFLQ
jgi:hypothetical protein